MASSSPPDVPNGAKRSPQDEWDDFELAGEILPLAIEVFGTPAEARSWIELVDRIARQFWRTPDYLRAIAEAGLDRDAYERWYEAGAAASYLPIFAKDMTEAGITPDDVHRWTSSGLSPFNLALIVQCLDFDDAMKILLRWENAAAPEYRPGSELVRLMNSGFKRDELWELLEQGFCGHDVFEWVNSGSHVPRTEWLSWQQQGVDPDDADDFRNRGISPESAHEWVMTGLPSGCIMRCIDMDYSRAEAVERYHPLNQLPDVIEPGQISLTLWPGNTAYEVTFTWDGGREAQWSHDISDANADLSPMSSAPVFGTATWLNGRDLETTYSSGDFGIDGEDVIEGAAPTAGAEDPDQVMRDPQRWVDFAEMIHGYVWDLLN